MSLVQSGRAALEEDYNTPRSNRSIFNDDLGDDADQDTDGDGIEDGVETAQDYNSSRSNKPGSVAADGDGEGSGLQVVYITKGADGKVYAWGGGPEAKSQDGGDKSVSVTRQVKMKSDGSGKLYSWGRVPDSSVDDDAGEDYNSPRSNRSINAPADDIDVCDGVTCADGSCAATADDCDVDDDIVGENYNSSRSNRSINAPDDDIDVCDGVTCPDGSCSDTLSACEPATESSVDDGKVYAWGDNDYGTVSATGDHGFVYTWGVAARATAVDDEGKIYAWGVRPQVESVAEDQRGIDKKDIRRGMVTDTGPDQPGNALYLAKELGLASAGNDIENIKRALDRCDDGVCEQVRLNADKRDEAVRRALENPSGMDGE
ncbi:MAG: hypothetical protein LC655_07775, partial [Bacteroidales bacterium]|nr:hypothetical protein [Bacteroidales bacterium]